jgi:integrase/recombinase XerD
VPDKPGPFFTSDELSRLARACQGGTFAQRRDAVILAVFRATGVRIAELAAIRYHPGGPARGDLDLERREIRGRGKGGRDRIVRIDHEAAAALTGTCAHGQGTSRRTGWGCGSGPAAAGR